MNFNANKTTKIEIYINFPQVKANIINTKFAYFITYFYFYII